MQQRNNPMGLAALMSFINKPAPQAASIQSLMLPYKQRSEAERAAEAQAAQAEQMGLMAPDIYGVAGTQDQPGIMAPYQMSADELMPGEGAIPGLANIVQEPVQGTATGIYDESTPIQRRMMEMNQRMLESGNPGFIEQWAKNQSNMQSSGMSNLGAMEREQFKAQNPGMSTHGKTAIDAGFIPGTPGFTEYVQKLAEKSMFEKGANKPFNTSELGKWMTKDGKAITYGTPAMAQSGDIVLRDTMNAGDTGRYTQVEAAVAALPTLKDNLFMDDGEINEEAIDDMWVKNLVSTMPAFVATAAQPILNKYMSPQGQQLASAYESGIQAITRAETGAAMPDTEIGNTRGRFLPEPNEDPAVSVWKYNAYENLLKNAKKYMSPIMRGRDPKNMSDADRAEVMNKAIDQAFADTPRPGQSAIINQPASGQPVPGMDGYTWK